MGGSKLKFTWRWGAAFACGFTLLLCGLRAARGGPPQEYLVKAAFLYNFAQFVEWPPDAFNNDPKAPIVIGIEGEDPFQGALDRAMTNKVVLGHPVPVRHFASAAEVDHCHILFVPANLTPQLKSTLEKLGGASCLTVGESDNFLDEGGMIRFYLDENKLRFEINAKAAEKARLKLSAKLLKLAKIYGD